MSFLSLMTDIHNNFVKYMRLLALFSVQAPFILMI